MVPLGSALSATARQLPKEEKEGAGCIVVVARKCARPKAAPHLRMHVVSASSMVLAEHAIMMAAPAVQVMDLSIASHTAERRASRALWRAAPPTLKSKASVPNTAVVLDCRLHQRGGQPAQDLQYARWTWLAMVTARSNQNAGRPHSRLVVSFKHKNK